MARSPRNGFVTGLNAQYTQMRSIITSDCVRHATGPGSALLAGCRLHDAGGHTVTRVHAAPCPTEASRGTHAHRLRATPEAKDRMRGARCEVRGADAECRMPNAECRCRCRCRCRMPGAGCRVPGAGCRVPGAGCRVRGAGCGVRGAGCGVRGAGCRVPGAGCRVPGAGCGVQGAGCRVPGAGCGVSGVGCRCRMQNAECRMQNAECRMQQMMSRRRDAACRYFQVLVVSGESTVRALSATTSATDGMDAGWLESTPHPPGFRPLLFTFCSLRFPLSLSLSLSLSRWEPRPC
jgi:hypothetical protein